MATRRTPQERVRALMAENKKLREDKAALRSHNSTLKINAKTLALNDAMYVAEIRNDLARHNELSPDDKKSKAAELLRDWEQELMTKAGIKSRRGLKRIFIKEVGEYLW